MALAFFRIDRSISPINDRSIDCGRQKPVQSVKVVGRTTATIETKKYDKHEPNTRTHPRCNKGCQRIASATGRAKNIKWGVGMIYKKQTIAIKGESGARSLC